MSNELLAYILAVINPIAFVIGIMLTLQVWELRRNGKANPLCVVIAAVLLAYQSRNLITAITVWQYSSGLVRPTGLLIWSLLGRLLEITGTSVGVLYLSGKVQFQGLLDFVLPKDISQPPRPPQSGDLPPTFWMDAFTSVVRANIKPEYLNPLD